MMDITEHPATKEGYGTRLMQYIAVAAATVNYERPVNDFGPSSGSDVAVMDALASICVSQARKEAFAVGLQFNQKGGLLDILVASNHNQGDWLRNVKEHLENVWRKVQELGIMKVEYAEGHRLAQCALELEAMIVKHAAEFQS